MPNLTTPAVPGAHGPLIQSLLPDWLKHATAGDLERLGESLMPQQHAAATAALWFSSAAAAERQALTDYQARSRLSAHALANLLKDFKGLTDFAEPLLQARLKADLQLDVPVSSAELVQIQRDSVLLGAMLKLKPHWQSLLQAALQNFPADATFEAGSALAPQGSFDMEPEPGSETGIPRWRFYYRETYAPSAQQFARLCHALDLGQQYQQHLSDIFEAPTTRQAVRNQSIQVYKDQLRVRAQVAFMKSEISDAARQMLFGLLEGETAPAFNGKPVRVSQLELFDAPVFEVLVISADRDVSEEVEPVVVYTPGAPLYPLKEYPSFAAALLDFQVNLRLPAYEALLRRYLLQPDQARVLAAVKRELFKDVERADGMYESVPNPNPRLNLRETSLRGEFFGFLQDRCLYKLKTDARVLAVPSAEVDEQARDARRAQWEGMGLNVLNAAALLVPGLGEVMAAVTAAQLINEVIDGAQAWEDGDVGAAWEHLKSVGGNVALMAGLGVLGQAAVPMARSAVVDALVPVRLPSGEQRLWQPRLEPYAADVDLSAVTPDSQGLHAVGEKRYIRIEGRSHEVFQDDRGGWRIRAENPAGYQPELQHNGQGSWRLQAESPLRWQGLQLWRRLGHVVDGLSDEALLQLAETTGTSEDRLRRVLVNNEALPPLLEDAAVRRQIDRRISDVLQQLRQGEILPASARRLPLSLLSRLPGWPDGVLLQVAGEELPRAPYGTSVGADDRIVTISSAQLEGGDFLSQTLELLSEQEQKALIGPYLAGSLEGRIQQVREVMADFGQRHRARAFEVLYSSEHVPDIPAMRTLQRDFPGLPWRAAKALAAQADGAELGQLTAEAARVPLRLAEEARWLLEEVRLNRACEGLYLGYPQSADVRRLALNMLGKLTGWSGEVRLEARERNVQGTLLDQAGGADASQRKTLIVTDAGFQPLDEDGEALAPAQSLFAAILHALPDSERNALGLAIDQPDALRLALARQVAQDRNAARMVLGMRARYRWFQPPIGLDDGRIGYPLSGRGAGRIPTLRELLTEQAHEIYPGMTTYSIRQWVESLNMSDAQLAVELQRRRLEYQQLQVTLEAWVAEEPQVLPQFFSAENVRQQRQLFQTALLRSWRRETFEVLRLIGLRIGTWPALAADFSHVRTLLLNDLQLREVPQAFLQQFREITSLHLERNELTQLPAWLAELPGLRVLNLFCNTDFVLDDAALALFASLPALTNLNLSLLRIAVMPNMAALVRLESLNLSFVGLTQWPQGLEQLTRLYTLDMRGNQISTIPEYVLAPERSRAVEMLALNRSTDLSHNPLDEDSLARLAQYYRRHGVSLGVRAHHLPGGEVPVLPAVENVQPWLEGLSAEEQASNSAIWHALGAEEDNHGLFDLLEELRQSADFMQGYDELRARVWALLRDVSESTDVREAIHTLLNDERNCADAVSLMFSDMEVLVLTRRAYALATPEATEQALVELGRGLFRLQQVEDIAQADINLRREVAEAAAAAGDSSDDEGEDIDEVEIRLAYRVGLAEALNLPGQPRGMRFAVLAEIPAEEMADARVEVLARETLSARREHLGAQAFWQRFLEQRNGERFSEVDAPFHAALDALDEQQLTSQAYVERSAQIAAEQQAARKVLVNTLTAEVFERLYPGAG